MVKILYNRIIVSVWIANTTMIACTCLAFSTSPTRMVSLESPLPSLSYNQHRNVITSNRLQHHHHGNYRTNSPSSPSTSSYHYKHHHRSSTKLQMAPIPPPPPQTLFASIQNFISLFTNISSASSATAALDNLTSTLIQTNPLIYFLVLLSAGFGVPVSEDALCVFCGTILPNLPERVRRYQLLVALLAGVVGSDLITFGLGRIMSYGLMKPIQKRLNLTTQKDTFCEIDYDAEGYDEDDDVELMDDCIEPTPELRKRDKILTILENNQSNGWYVGFLIRFSVGMRGPMMLLTGFSRKISTPSFILGSTIGGLCSLTLQLLLGYTMRKSPAAVLGLVASISTFVLMIPVCLAVGSWLSLVQRRVVSWRTAAKVKSS